MKGKKHVAFDEDWVEYTKMIVARANNVIRTNKCLDCGEIYKGRELILRKCPSCGSENMEADDLLAQIQAETAAAKEEYIKEVRKEYQPYLNCLAKMGFKTDIDYKKRVVIDYDEKVFFLHIGSFIESEDSKNGQLKCVLLSKELRLKKMKDIHDYSDALIEASIASHWKLPVRVYISQRMYGAEAVKFFVIEAIAIIKSMNDFKYYFPIILGAIPFVEKQILDDVKEHWGSIDNLFEEEKYAPILEY